MRLVRLVFGFSVLCCFFVTALTSDAFADSGAIGMTAVWEKLCDTGPGKLKLSNGKSFYLFAYKYSTPALVFRYPGGLCYAKLAEGEQAGTLNFKRDGKVYHLIDEVL